MNITHISLRNFRSWAKLELSIEPGCTLLSGRNGAGKTSIIEAALFAMYGASSDAGSYIRRGTDEASVVVVIETEQGEVTITRGVRRSGATAKVGMLLFHAGENITAATVTETQRTLDDMLGVSRDVLVASAFSTQHGGAAFTEAKPADRKRIFGEILTLGMWDTLHEEAKAEQRDARAIAAAAKVRADQLAGAEERLLRALEEEFAAHERKKGAAEDERNAEAEVARLAGEAEAAREARRQHAAAVEAAERARADHERATAERAAAEESLERIKAAAANAPDLTRAQQEAHEADLELAEIEAEQAALRESSSKWREEFAEAERELRICGDGRDEVALRMMGLRERLATASGDVCPECRQDLVTAEAKGIVGRMRGALAAATEQLASCDQGVAIWQARIDGLKANSGIAPDDAKLRIFQRRSQEAQAALARAETTNALAGSIEAAEERAADAVMHQRKAAHRLAQADGALTDAKARLMENDGGEKAGMIAANNLDQTRRAHREAAAELARCEAAAQHAERDATEEAAARTALAEATQREAVASILAAGFGPQGVPALIVDSILVQLADESNRVLAELGTPIRVDLRSQRVTRDSRLVDALDIIVLDGTVEAPYETLSGGERTRVALSLRAALTRLLAAKSGARIKIMVIDEPAFLDAAGADQFAQTLQDFVSAGVFDSVILVAHQHELADQIGRVIRVTRDAGGDSQIASTHGGQHHDVTRGARPVGPQHARRVAGVPLAEPELADA